MNAQSENYPLQRVDLITLRLFLTVVDTGSIRAAAETLNISPSAVSRRLTEMERDLGQSFLLRHSRGVEVSEAGRIMASNTRKVFAAIDNITLDLRRLENGETGTVLLSANGSSLVSGLSEDLQIFGMRHMSIGVELFEQLSPQVVEAVVGGKTELGLIARTFRIPPELESIPYCQDKLVLAVPAGHALQNEKAVTLEDIAAYPTIGVLEGSSMTRLVRRVSVLRTGNVNFRYMAGSCEVARALVRHGHGIAILPAAFVTPYEHMLSIVSVPIGENWAEREISIIQHRDKPLSKAAAFLRDFLLQQSLARSGSSV